MSHDKSFQDRLWAVIKDIRFPMLAHRHLGGRLHAHPLTMKNKSLKPGEPLHFFVSRNSELAERLRVDGTVCITYADPEKDRYASVSGRAVVSDDMAIKRRLFNALDKAWFAGGADDPDLELVEVEIEHAEYWDIKESKTIQLSKLATAAVTGKPPELGEHREFHIGSKEPAAHG